MNKKIGWAKSNDGFTIIEVMIFLAVSGMMFIMAAVMINGKQGQVSFRQGMESSASVITNVIDTVANGEYPDVASFTCNAGASGVWFTPSAGAGQGANNGCIFLGKVLQLGTGSDGIGYSVYTVAGRQYKPASTLPVQTFADAAPSAVYSAGNGIDITQTGTLEAGLAYDSGYLCEGDCSGSSGNSRTPIGGVGFFGSFGSYNDGSANSQTSGAQSVTVATLPTGDMTDNIKNYSDITVLSGGEYALLCFSYGNSLGNVTVGGQNGQQTSVNVDFNKGAC